MLTQMLCYCSQDGESPLHVASSFNSIECVNLLLTRGADPNELTMVSMLAHARMINVMFIDAVFVYIYFIQYWWSPLHVATYNGHTECIEYLLLHGADVNIQNLVSYFNIQKQCNAFFKLYLPYYLHRTTSFCECYFCKDGFTPFHMAAMLGNKDLLDLLLLRGADVNAVATVRKSFDLRTIEIP